MSLGNTKNIKVSIIIEIAGRPPEHLTETLEDIIKKIGEEKGVEIINKQINDPVLMKNQKDFYTSFAVVEIEIDDIAILSHIAMNYMPAHIEIIEPELIAFTNNGWNDLFNGILQRLHKYDEVARIMQSEKKILENKLKSLLEKKKE